MMFNHTLQEKNLLAVKLTVFVPHFYDPTFVVECKFCTKFQVIVAKKHTAISHSDLSQGEVLGKWIKRVSR